jgi:uncharacterized iron-regulated membrane protein
VGRRKTTWREKLESTRSLLALALVLTIPFVVVVSSIAFLWRLQSVANIRDFAIAILGAVTGISGAVVGFYFGEKAGREEEREQRPPS